MIAFSFARAMLMWRKVFSSSLAISAVPAEETGTARSTKLS
jgi:hypothetical protein